MWLVLGKPSLHINIWSLEPAPENAMTPLQSMGVIKITFCIHVSGC